MFGATGGRLDHFLGALQILEKPEYVEEDYAGIVAKDNEDLLKKVNTAMQELKDDGTIQSIIDKYITAE